MDFAHKLADRSGYVIHPYFRRSIAVDNKAEHGAFDPVTEADRAAEAAMRELIIAEYPDHGILGEEFDNREANGPFSWTLDPIDGTRSFMIGLPAWGTLIGLSHNGEPTLGVMDQPHIGERFWGTGTAAYYRHASGERSTLKTRACPSLGDAILAATAPD
ncbi:MAG: inositol monophosphatase family protein, partial [Alphaproteobacteria bacterium]